MGGLAKANPSTDVPVPVPGLTLQELRKGRPEWATLFRDGGACAACADVALPRGRALPPIPVAELHPEYLLDGPPDLPEQEQVEHSSQGRTLILDGNSLVQDFP